MREAEWVERLWQQISQLATQVALKEDVRQLYEKLDSLAHKDSVERIAGKLDTLLINAATKVEVGRVESRLEQMPSKEDLQRLEDRLSKSLPHIVTKQEWSAMESRLARTLTKDDFVHTLNPLRDAFNALDQRLSELVQQLSQLRTILWFLLALNVLTLVLLIALLLKPH